MSGSSGSGWTKTIYRVRGISSDSTEEDLCGIIQALFDVQQAEFRIHSLALDVVEGDDPPEKVATITFQSTPAKLSDSECQSWNFGVPGSLEDRIYFDNLLKGLTPLTPEKNNSTSDTDCIFIHGWGGSALGSLIAEDDPKYVWLRDDIPSKIPRLRVWTYGHGARLTDETYVSDPFEEAEGLKLSLRSLRCDPQKRPIIFIVHSLGGLIFKQVVISLSKSNNPEDVQNLELVTGALFFGVPGNGMDVQSLASMVQGSPSQYTLDLIDEDTGFRQRIHQDDDFNRVWAKRHVQIIYFLEKRKTPTVVKTANGWSRNGPLSLLVKSGSAAFGQHNRGGDSIITLDKDHNSMIKFSRNDRDEYRKVWKALQSLADTAATSPQLILGRQDIADQQRSYNVSFQTFQDVSEEQKRKLDLEQQFVDDLYSQVLQSRTRQIPEAATGTYEWIFDGEQSFESSDLEDTGYKGTATEKGEDLQDEDIMEVEGFPDAATYTSTASQSNQENTAAGNESAELRGKKRQLDAVAMEDSQSLLRTTAKKRRTTTACGSTGFSEWLHNGRGIYWITGRPGSGKSTMMKFIAQHPVTKEALQAWASPMEVTIVSFYFFISGSSLQRSLLGLLQSIFHQIVKDDRSLIRLLFPWEWRKMENSKHIEWTENSFMDAVELLQNVQHQRKFCFLIDGLDEYKGEEDHEWLCRFLLKLSNLENIKLCVSSRYWQVFQSAFSKCPTLRLHEWTRSDIHKFIHQQLEVHNLWLRLREADPKQAGELVYYIANNAKGVFLWVFLVVRSFVKGLEKGDSFNQLQTHIFTMPKSLDGVFKRILQDIPEEDRDFVIKALLVVKTHSNWISPPLIIFYYLADETTSLNQQGRILPYLRDICTRIRRRLNAVCGDLLTVDDEDDEDFEVIGFAFSLVRFMHRTIADYIDGHINLEPNLLQDGSKFDEVTYVENVLLALSRALPADVPKRDVIVAVRLVYNIWQYKFQQYPGKIWPRFEYLEELDKSVLAIFKAMAIDIHVPWSLPSDDFPTGAEHPYFVIGSKWYGSPMEDYINKRLLILGNLAVELAGGGRIAYHSRE